MAIMIGYPRGISQRVFPLISPNLYNLSDELQDLNPDQQAARKLLALARKNFSWWQRYTGWGLYPSDRVARMLFQHRLAVETELAGQWDRADFFWKQVYVGLNKLSKKPEFWKALTATKIAKLGTVVIADHKQLLQRLIEEVFIDTHCAFYNNRLDQSGELSLQDRAFKHLDYLQALVDLAGLSAEAQYSLLGPALDIRLTLTKEAKRYKQAIQICRNLCKIIPVSKYYADELLRLHFADTISQLSTDSRPHDIQILQEGINAISHLQKDYKHNILFFELVSQLHHLRAHRMAENKRFAEALEAVQMAITYYPFSTEANQLKATLTQVMEKLQGQIIAVQTQLRSNHRASLTAEGRQLLAEAQKGFSLIKRYIDSDEAKQTSTAFKVAYNRTLWIEIGLTEPEAGWDEKANALMMGVNQIFAHPPQEEIKVSGVWQEIAQTNKHLSELQIEPIVTFLKQRLFHKNEKDISAKVSGETYQAPSDPPLFKGRSQIVSKTRGVEWFGYWLFSREGMALKGGVLLTLIIIGWLTYQTLQLRQARDVAYMQLTQAINAKDYPAVIVSADDFLMHPSFLGEDARQQEVLDFRKDAEAIQERDRAFAKMEAAFVEKDYETVLAATKIFVENPPLRLADDRQQQVVAYQQDAQAGLERDQAFDQLKAAFADKDYPSVVTHADHFLDNPPILEEKDAREKQVLEFKQLAQAGQVAKETAYEQIIMASDTQDFLKLIEGAEVYLEHTLIDAPQEQDLAVLRLYRAAFVRWFARLDGPPDEVALAHVDHYRKLIIK